MRTYSTAGQNALIAGAIVKRRMVLFELASGDFGFWDGDAEITPVDGSGGIQVDDPASGKTFKTGGSLFEIQVGAFGADGSAPEITIRLRSVPASPTLTPDVLAEIFETDYKNARCSIFRALLNTSTGALIEVALRARGYIDHVQYVEQPSADGPGTAYLEAKVESPLIEANRKGAHDRNHESQKITFPGDEGLRNIDRIGKVRRWAKGVKK